MSIQIIITGLILLCKWGINPAGEIPLTNKPEIFFSNTLECLQPSNCDSIIQNSDVFKLNNIDCFWKFIPTSIHGNAGTGKMTLINRRTQQTILQYEDSYKDICSTIDFKQLNKNSFKDVNFDNYSDYVVLSNKESGSGGDFYNIYLFDKPSGIFKLSELSGGSPISDQTKRTLTTTWKSGNGNYTVHTTCFDLSGKIKYLDIFKEETGTEDVIIQTNQRISNGKTEYIKTDTLQIKTN